MRTWKGSTSTTKSSTRMPRYPTSSKAADAPSRRIFRRSAAKNAPRIVLELGQNHSFGPTGPGDESRRHRADRDLTGARSDVGRGWLEPAPQLSAFITKNDETVRRRCEMMRPHAVEVFLARGDHLVEFDENAILDRDRLILPVASYPFYREHVDLPCKPHPYTGEV
jgi:hypothetical protein